MFTKNFARIVCRQELNNDEIELFFDIVNEVVPTKVVTAWDERKEEVGVEVIMYDDVDEDGDLYIYEIILAEEIDPDEGDQISEIIFNEFDDITFSFEASIEV